MVVVGAGGGALEKHNVINYFQQKHKALRFLIFTLKICQNPSEFNNVEIRTGVKGWFGTAYVYKVCYHEHRFTDIIMHSYYP